eukprot:g621.t1
MISIEELRLLVSSLGKRMSQEQLNDFVKENRPKRLRRGSTGGMTRLSLAQLRKIGARKSKITPLTSGPRSSTGSRLSDSSIGSRDDDGSGSGTESSTGSYANVSEVNTLPSSGSEKGSALNRQLSSSSTSSIISSIVKRNKTKVDKRKRSVLSLHMHDSSEKDVQIRREEFETIIGKFRTVGAVMDSRAAEDDESEERNAKVKSWICMHDSTWRVAWDLMILIILIYVMLIVPYRLGFDHEATGFVYILELLIDILFIVDIPIQFCTSYVNSQGAREIRWHRIGRHYFTGYFAIDFVSSIPWDFVLPDSGESSTANRAASSTRVMKTLRLAKLMKLGRMARVKKFITTFNEYINFTRESFHVVLAIVMLCLCAHIMACLWAFGGRYGIDEENFAVDSWQSRAGVVDSKRSDEYIVALYWAVTSVTTVGYGDIVPGSRVEYVIAIIAMAVGVSFYGYLTAVLTAFFLHEDQHQMMVKSKMDALNSYLSKHEYPREMQRKIKAYFLHFYDHTSSFDDVKMLQQLPYTLYESAADFLVQNILGKFVVFASINKNVIALILKVLKPMSASGDVIVKIGHPADTMYLINQGIVNITNRTGQIQAQFRAGQSFMEYAAFRMLRKHEFNAVAVSQCELYGLHADDLETIAEDRQHIRGDIVAFECIGQLRQNVILLEQFRAYAGCSLVGLDAKHENFEEAVVSMMLGRDGDMNSPVGGYQWRSCLKKKKKNSKEEDFLTGLGSSLNSPKRGGGNIARATSARAGSIHRIVSQGSTLSDHSSEFVFSNALGVGSRIPRQRQSFRRPSMAASAMIRRNHDEAILSALTSLKTEISGLSSRMGSLESAVGQ